MMLLKSTVPGLLFFAALLLGYFMTRSLAARRLMIVVAFLCAMDALAFGGGSLHSLAEAARDAGRSEDFVQGIAELNKVLIPVKARAALGAFVLFVLALTGAAAKRKSDCQCSCALQRMI